MSRVSFYYASVQDIILRTFTTTGYQDKVLPRNPDFSNPDYPLQNWDLATVDLGDNAITNCELISQQGGGYIDNLAVTRLFPPETPEEMLTVTATLIMDGVVEGNIDAELEQGLLANVDAALAALDRGNPNDAKVAMNDLKALINQVEAQMDKKITADVAAQIIQNANAIITQLGG